MSLHAGTDDNDELPPRAISAAERVLLAISLGALGLICLVVTYTVIARTIHTPLIPDDVQIVRQLLVVVIIFPMAAVTALRMHIAVTIFTEKLKRGAKRSLIVFGDVLGLALFTVLLAGSVELFTASFTSGEYFDGDIDIPYWMVHGAYMVALAVLWLRMAGMTWTDCAQTRAAGANR
jgi:TRAP-type C4-dicarboxylate transport system permease small subunit